MKTENKVLKRISRIAGIKSEQLIPISFFGAILLGALLLMLPFSTAKGESTSFDRNRVKNDKQKNMIFVCIGLLI